MKKNNLIFIIIISISLSWNIVRGQNSSTCPTCLTAPVANFPAAGTDYLGWAAGSYPTVGSLNIRTMDLANPLPIDYWTQAKARMQIYENVINPADPSSGNIAIGDFTTFIPQSLVHQHNNGLVLPYYDTYHQFTNINTGYYDMTATRPFTGMQVGLNYDNTVTHWPASGPVPPYNEAALKHWEQSPLIFYTVDDANLLRERMRITYGLGSDHHGRDYAPPTATGVTKVTISHEGNVHNPAGGTFIPDEQAVAMLNLGENHSSWNGAIGAVTPYFAGARTWMDVGTYYNFDSDNMYTGLKDDGGNAKDAVINWGDDPSLSPDLSDHLLFVFTQVNGGAGQSGTEDGLEVARMSGIGHVGIGNFTLAAFGNGVGIPPARRLEILDESLNTLDALTPAPQLRLTFSPTNPNGTTTPGKYTDFQSTANGDLYINPMNDVSATAVNGNVGIHKLTPGNTLEINSNLTAPGTEPAGLRFTNLKAVVGATVNTNPFLAAIGAPAVLSVDPNGDVILVGDNGEVGNYCGAPTPNPLTGDYEIPLTGGAGSYDYYFTGQKDGSTDVLIGNPCSNSTTYAKLQAYQPTNQTSSPLGESDAARFTNTTTNKHAFGGVGIADHSKDNNYGLKGFAALNVGASNYGVLGTTVNFPPLLSNINVGVYGFSPANSHSGSTI